MTLKDIKWSGCRFDMIPLSEEKDKIRRVGFHLLNITVLLCDTNITEVNYSHTKAVLYYLKYALTEFFPLQ